MFSLFVYIIHSPVAIGLVLAPGNKPRDCVALSTGSCDLSCDHGYRSDHHGCEICQCMNQPGTCISTTGALIS